MKTMQSVLLLCLALLSGAADAVVFNAVQPDKSTLKFTVKQMGVPVQGGFSRFAAQLDFDPAKPSAASAVIDADLSSVDAGSTEANDEVLGSQWFNVKAYPRARFVSSSVRSLGGNRYEAIGKLTIKGRTNTVTAPFTVVSQGSTARFDGSFILKRADYAIGEGEWASFDTVANDIRIVFHIQAASQPASRK
jgi:polyisoprenoid-binding protein YceI